MKSIKFIQINIYKGKYLDELLDFLKKEEPDFIAAQEVTYGLLNHVRDKTLNLFEVIKSRLGMEGISYFDWKVEGDVGSLGNAVFSKYPISEHKVLVLREPTVVPLAYVESEESFPTAPRHFIDAVCEISGKQLHVASWHGAWTAPPQDTAETLRQAQMVADYLKSLDGPFIIGCDVNSTPQSKTVGLINQVANNLMMNSGVIQTLHPKVHKIAPRGFLIDYIFISRHFRLKFLEVPQVTVSDHLPVVAELELAA